jgi:hypothetical protein
MSWARAYICRSRLFALLPVSFFPGGLKSRRRSRRSAESVAADEVSPWALDLLGVNADCRTSPCRGVSSNMAELRRRTGRHRLMRAGCVVSADGSLTMIMLSASLGAAPGGR